MPSSKRARILPTSKTAKNRKDLVRRLHSLIQSSASTYAYIFVFDVQNMRNNMIKTVRTDFSDSRIVMGKTKVMSVALGRDKETECVPGVSALGAYVTGEVGLLFTDRDPKEVEAYFETFGDLDYARSGSAASWEVRIPQGEIRTQYGVEGGEDEVLPMAIEPQLRKLGVPTRIKMGKVVLEDAAEGVIVEDGEEGYLVCKEGDILDSRQTSILKIIGVRMAEFKVGLRAIFDKGAGSVTEIRGMEVDDDMS
jgi:mRNA turnover protein 4